MIWRALVLLALTGCARTTREAHVAVLCGRHTCRGTAELPTENVTVTCTDGREWIIPWAWLIGQDRGRR
jgi:hypothetical protein